MKRILLIAVLIISGCAPYVYHNAAGDPAPKEIIFDCRQKCDYWNLEKNSSAINDCVESCLDAKGYK
ncbi:MAG: hypothetical protein ABSD50_08910 [Smithella sp.]